MTFTVDNDVDKTITGHAVSVITEDLVGTIRSFTAYKVFRSKFNNVTNNVTLNFLFVMQIERPSIHLSRNDKDMKRTGRHIGWNNIKPFYMHKMSGNHLVRAAIQASTKRNRSSRR